VAGRKIFVSHDSGLVTAHPEVNPKTGVRVGDKNEAAGAAIAAAVAGE
jgi:hypothetical protein